MKPGEKIRHRNMGWLWLYKEKYGCADCSETDPNILEFHHKESHTKEKAVASMVQVRDLQIIKNEVAKCVVLCANCHRKRHAPSKEIINSYLQCYEELGENFIKYEKIWLSDDAAKKMLNEYLAGATYKQIREKYGISRATIDKKRKDLGFPAKCPKSN